MKYTAVLFDLDGTLTDPKLGITKSVQYALSRFHIAEEDLDRLEPFIGPPLVQSFQEMYHFTESDAWKAVGYYREYFADKGIFENEVYPGIPELLAKLSGQGRPLIIATSKPTVFADRIAKHFHLDSYFDAVVGSQLDGTLSDKGEIIRHIVETMELNAASAVMIGDRKHDVIGARRNGMDSIGVEYGYGSAEEMDAIRPTYRVKTVEELGLALL